VSALPCRLRRAEASTYLLTNHGVRRTPQTLAKYAVVGGGPRFVKFGASVLYAPADLDEWVAEHMSTPRQSTSAQAA